ncbi:MAG: cobaltochelatase subunit CobN, partial [bacterium]
IREVLGDRLSAAAYIKDMQEMREQAKKIAQLASECQREMMSLFAGFAGQYIPTGPSGCPTRGRLDTLPTGKNFYSMDPYTIPTKAAWRVGRVLATRLIEKYEADTGMLPENCGMVLFCTDIMWTSGEQVSQILYLLGVEPIWAAGGRIKDLRVIPLEELNRPRIDVTLRIGSIVRDCFPMTVDLIDKAVRLTAALDEPEEMNYVRKHTLANYNSLLEENKAESEKLLRQATARIFGSKPGTYGSGVNLAVYASAWKDEHDLAEVYVYWSGYAYGEEMYGDEAQEQFINQLQTMNMTFKNNATDEHDLFGCCCHFSYQGGLTAAANAVSGNKVKTYHGDTRDPSKPEVLDLADEIRRVVRTKILNPKWIEGMKRHGYKGASDISKRIGRIYGWEATTQEVDDWIFDDIASTYVLNEENRRFFEENNPWALEEIGRRLLEANQRELWLADKQILEQLKEQYLEVEGWLEERMGDVAGEFQGGSVDIMNMDDVADWSEKMQSVRDKLHKRKK